jgi:hypothetical protein
MTHRNLRLPLAGLHVFIGLGGLAGGIVMAVAPDATPHILRLAVPRPTILAGPAWMLIGASALLVAWSTLRADRTAKASFATAGALLMWVVMQGFLVGLRSWLQILIFLVAVAAILITAALASAEGEPISGSGRLVPGSE